MYCILHYYTIIIMHTYLSELKGIVSNIYNLYSGKLLTMICYVYVTFKVIILFFEKL